MTPRIQLRALVRVQRRWSRRLKNASLTLAATVWRRLLLRTTFVAISGSLGKTTTRELLHAVLQESASSVRTPNNANLARHRGPQRTVLHARPWHRYCVVEIGIEQAGDMEQAARLVRPDVAVLLNVARCHTRSFPTLDELAEEKGTLLRHVGRGGVVVLNAASPPLVALTIPSGVRHETFVGWTARADTLEDAGVDALDALAPADSGNQTPCQATNQAANQATSPPLCRVVDAESPWPGSLSVIVDHADVGRRRYETRLVGEHWANAVVATIATARALDIDHDTIARALARVPNWHRRLEPVSIRSRGAVYVRDEYNGSIESLLSALAWIRRARAERRIVVQGDATDVRVPTRDRSRARYLIEMSAASCDHLVPISPYTDLARRTAVAAGLKEDRVSPVSGVHGAIDWCRAELRAGDLLLCKGRGEQKLERVYLGLFGDVVCRRETCALKRTCAECSELGFEVTPAMLEGSAEVLGGRPADVFDKRDVDVLDERAADVLD